MSYLQSLSVFIAVAEEENFTAAAKKLSLTQPTVSFHMDNLEKNLGCLLFNRTSKGVTLTPYGQRLYESAKVVDATLKTTYQEIRQMAEGNLGHIFVGASTIPGEYILPPLISGFMRVAKDIRFTLATGDSNYILDAFKSGQYSIAVTGIKPSDFAAVSLWEDELVLVGHPDFVAAAGTEAADMLLRMPLIMRTEPSGSRKTIVETLSQYGIRIEDLNVVLEVTGNQALKIAMLHKAGIGFISKWAVKEELSSGLLRIIDLKEFSIRRTFYLMSNPLLETAGSQRFTEFLMQSEMYK